LGECKKILDDVFISWYNLSLQELQKKERQQMAPQILKNLTVGITVLNSMMMCMGMKGAA